MKINILYIILLIILTSCISEKELVTKIEDSKIKDKVEIENLYSNKNLNNNTYQNLIQILDYHYKHKIFKNHYKLNDSVKVKIVFDGIDNLNVCYNDTNNNLINYNLKVKNKGKYLTLKRKFKIIPIPFIFGYYWNEKTIVYIDNNNDLNFLSGQNQFIWILLAGGGKNIYENKFEILKNKLAITAP